MGAVNRDKESLYPPGKLSRWFAVTSGLLVLSMLWMFWADYARPWRKYQEEFNDQYLDVAKAKRERAREEQQKFKDRIDAESSPKPSSLRRIQRGISAPQASEKRASWENRLIGITPGTIGISMPCAWHSSTKAK